MKSDQQVMFEAGLIAIIDTAKKAYKEGFLEGASASESEHLDEEINDYWLQSEVCAACVKALKQYGVDVCQLNLNQTTK